MDHSTIPMILGMKLRQFRQKIGLSLKELSERSGMSASYLNEIEKGKKYPKAEKMMGLAKALDIPYDELVSLKLDDELTPLAPVLNSVLFQKFPFHIFGIAPRELLQLMVGHPKEMSTLVGMLTELGGNYDMRIEHFFHTAMRCYQVIHKNYFEDVEEAVDGFRKDQKWKSTYRPGQEELAALLEKDYGCAIDEATLTHHETLSFLRTVTQSHPDRLLLNAGLSGPQKAFAIARELGGKVLDVKERSFSSPSLEVGDFEQVFNNFRMSYFSSALLLPKEALKRDLTAFFKRPNWDPDVLLGMLKTFDATPEMLFYRLSELVPHFTRITRLHFLKFSKKAGENRVSLVKQFNTSRVHIPQGIGLKEHFCRRWLSVHILTELEQRGGTEPLVGAQRSRFIGFGTEFFCFAVASRDSLDPDVISSVTLGFQVDDALKKTIRFWNDPAIPWNDLGQTCERCPLKPDECDERAVPATLHERSRENKRKRAELELLLGRG